MARKKVEPITGLIGEDKLTVQKSLPLFDLWRSDLTLAEFKILDTYLSRIDSHKPERRAVMFGKGELEKLLSVKKINNKDLETRLKHLMGNVVKLDDRESKRGFRLVSLFEEAVAEQDEDGQWQVKLECTQKAMKYFFNIENLGYLRYKLRCITSITSRYTYIMFTYLEHNRYRKCWQVPLDELKKILDCDNVETYSAFKEFNKQVLKRVQRELHDKTECRYAYEPIKRGRSVVAVRFEVETLPKAVEDDGQMTIEQWEQEREAADVDQMPELWQEPLQAFGFTPEQLDEIGSLLATIPQDRLPDSSVGYGSIEIMRYHYLDQKAKEITRRDAQKPIRHKFEYLVKLLKQDIREG